MSDKNQPGKSGNSPTKNNTNGKKPEDPPRKSVKWDEMNVMATLHPADKDYGHMKIDEPPTPYERERPEDGKGVDPKMLAARLEAAQNRRYSDSDSEGEDDGDEELVEQKKKREFFKKKRKEHYSEFLEAKKRLSKQAIDVDSDEEDDANIKNNSKQNSSKK